MQILELTHHEVYNLSDGNLVRQKSIVKASPTTISTIASWTSRILPYLTSSIMALVAFYASRQLVVKSRDGNGHELPTPQQLTLLIGLLGGNSLEPLKDTLLYRYAHKRKLAAPIPMAFAALAVITVIGYVV